MFGFTKLTSEEIEKRELVARIEHLENLIMQETVVRSNSLLKAEKYTAELNELTKERR